MRRSKTARLAVLLLCGFAAWCLTSARLEAQDRKLALDSDGTIYRLLQGTYGELFPDGTAASPDNPVLALDLTHAVGDSERWVVPSTEGWDLESSSSLVYEKSTREVHLLWQRRFNGLHPLLYLVSFDGVDWSEVIEIASGPFTNKGSPQLAVTREEERTVLHLMWWEEVHGAASRKRYAPIVIEAGRYIGTVPVYDLARFAPVSDGSLLGEVAGLEDILALRPGRNNHSVVLGFLNPDTHRVSTLEVEMLPSALSNLADGIRGHIVIIGAKSASRSELAANVRFKLLEIGTDFHQATRRFLADQVQEAIESSTQPLSPEGISSLADEIRGHIVIIGASIRAGGFENLGDVEVLEIGPSPGGGYHYLRISAVSDRPAPRVGRSAELFLSESGRNVLVTWEDRGRIYYTESLDDGWSEPGSIKLTEELDRETVYRMLAERARTD